MTKPLAEKTAVVTGATRGIGRAIATRLLADGATVIGTGTRQNGDIPIGATYEPVDFTKAESLSAFAEMLVKISPDILINNAGINKIGPFAQIKLEDFLAIQEVNVRAPFILCQAVVPGMKKLGWGRIINISSIWGKVARAGRASYATSKFGIDGMTAALAAEVAPFGILANCVAPGVVDTELTRNILGETGVKELSAEIPVGRLGAVTEIAAFVAWLAGPENGYISGQNIAIDGGFTRV